MSNMQARVILSSIVMLILGIMAFTVFKYASYPKVSFIGDQIQKVAITEESTPVVFKVKSNSDTTMWLSDVSIDSKGSVVVNEVYGENRNRTLWFNDSLGSLQVNKDKEVELSASVPELTPSGEYSVGLVTEGKNGNRSVEILSIIVDNPEKPEVHEVYLDQIYHDEKGLNLEFWNSGTATESLTASIEITNEADYFYSASFDLGKIYEHSRNSCTLKDLKKMESGIYFVSVSTIYNGEETTVQLQLNVE